MFIDFYQVIGFVAMIMSCVGSGLKSPRHSILACLIANIIWPIHYFGIGAIDAVWVSIIIVMRMGAGLILPEKYLKPSVIVFMIISAMTIAMSWEGGQSIAVLIAALSGHAVILYRDKGLIYRTVNLLCMTAWLIYHVWVVSYGGVVNDLIQIGLFAYVFFTHDLKSAKYK